MFNRRISPTVSPIGGSQCTMCQSVRPLIGASSVSVQERREKAQWAPGDSVQILPPGTLFLEGLAKNVERAARLKCELCLMRRFHAWRGCKRSDGTCQEAPLDGEMSCMCCRSVAPNMCVSHRGAFPLRANSQKPMELM